MALDEYERARDALTFNESFLLIAIADDLSIPTLPPFKEPDWYRSEFTEQYQLAVESRNDLRESIRTERGALRDERLSLVNPSVQIGSVVVGILGALTVLITVL